MAKADANRKGLSALWDESRLKESGLPGPRGNLAQAQAR